MTPEPVPLPEPVAAGYLCGCDVITKYCDEYHRAPIYFTADQLHAHAREFARRELEAAAESVKARGDALGPEGDWADSMAGTVTADAFRFVARDLRARAARLSEDGPRG